VLPADGGKDVAEKPVSGGWATKSWTIKGSGVGFTSSQDLYAATFKDDVSFSFLGKENKPRVRIVHSP
jgi:hypothetical protein